MSTPLAFIVAQGSEEGGDLSPVDVIATAFTLGFEHVIRAFLRIGGYGDGGLTGRGIIERIDCSEGIADTVDHVGVIRGGEETSEVRGFGRCKLLLDLLGAGEMGEDGGAFDRCGALEIEAGAPGEWGGVFGGGVAGAEVAEGYFVGSVGGVWWVVDKCTVRGFGDGGVVQDTGEGEAESGDLVRCL